MGDRVLFIVYNKQPREYSPVIYGHSSGYRAANILKQLHERMEGRRGDVPYATARLIGIMHESIPGNLSLGVWDRPAAFEHTEEYLADMSHGDAGVILYDCNDGSIECYGGYMTGDSIETLREAEDA